MDVVSRAIAECAMCITQQVTQKKILLTINWELPQKENFAPRAHTAPTAQSREELRTKCAGLASPTNSLFCVVLKHTTRLRIHLCACLKHSDFLNADRMRKSGLSKSCSHETLLLFGLQHLSQGRVKQLLSSSNHKTGISALNLVEHLSVF